MLEKVLAQTEQGLTEIDDLLAEWGDRAWVNINKRMQPWLREAVARFSLDTSVQVEISGPRWGMTCNGIHFLDLVSYALGQEVMEAEVTKPLTWFPSNRQGYWESFGELGFRLSRGATVNMSSSQVDVPFQMRIMGDKKECEIDLWEAQVKCSDGSSSAFSAKGHTDIVMEFIREIWTTRTCSLPSVKEAVALHQKFIRPLVVSWGAYAGIEDESDLYAPVT
ncbi:hypothetical protein V6X62_09350 [Spiribacter sp. 218]|uniref:hypothetical protein n=1 Tax=Spiribacter pallidus TaxID=1987936 RepID=UPI00349F7F92